MARYMVIATCVTKFYVTAESAQEAESLIVNGCYSSADLGNTDSTYETEELEE